MLASRQMVIPLAQVGAASFYADGNFWSVAPPDIPQETFRCGDAPRRSLFRDGANIPLAWPPNPALISGAGGSGNKAGEVRFAATTCPREVSKFTRCPREESMFTKCFGVHFAIFCRIEIVATLLRISFSRETRPGSESSLRCCLKLSRAAGNVSPSRRIRFVILKYKYPGRGE